MTKRVAVGFYKDEEGRTRPITRSTKELKRKKIVQKAKQFKGIKPKGLVNEVKTKLSKYYGIPLKDVELQLHDDEESYSKAHKEAFGKRKWKALAFGSPKDAKIHVNPKFSRILRETTHISTPSQCEAFLILAHEFGHVVSSTGGFETGGAFDEGANELLAVRFLIEELPIRLDRNKIPYHYKDEVEFAWNIALLVNNKNPSKALKWLRRFKTDSYKNFDRSEKAKEKLASYNPRFEKWFATLSEKTREVKTANKRLQKELGVKPSWLTL